MRATAVRRTALAASAAALALLATACGGTSDADKKDDKDAAGGSSSAPKAPAEALTAAELEKATLAQGDVKGRKVTKASRPTRSRRTESRSTRRPACRSPTPCTAWRRRVRWPPRSAR